MLLKRWIGTESFWLAVLLGGSLIVRLATLGIRPFDGDEGVVLAVVTQSSLHQALVLAANDVHPLLLFALSWLPIQLLGLSEWSARLVPALASVGVIWLTFLYWRSITNRRVAWLATILVAISAQNFFFAQELRFYSLLTLLTLGSVWLLTRLHERFSWLQLAGWAVVDWLLLETQHLAVIVIGAELVVIGWWIFKAVISNPLGGREIPPKTTGAAGSLAPLEMTKRFGLGLLLIVLLYAPTLPTTLHQFGGRLGGEDETGLAFRQNVVGTINGIYRLGVGNLAAGIDASPAGVIDLLRTDPVKLGTFGLNFLLLIGFLVYGWRSLTGMQRQALAPYLVVAATLILAAVGSRQVGERASRNLYLLSPLYFGLLATGISAVWPSRSRKQGVGSWVRLAQLATIMLLGFMLAGTVIHFQLIGRPGVREIVRFVDPQLRPSDVILTKGTYLRGESFIYHYYSATDPEVVDYYGDYAVGNLASINAVPVDQRINELLTRYDRVWFYDLIGDPVSWQGAPHQLGIDKEGLPLVVWEIQR